MRGLCKKIDSFEIVTLRMSGMRFFYEDEIVMKDGKAEVSRYSLCFHDDEEERVLQKRVECDEATILRLLNDCRLLSWDGFYGKHPRHVTDGTIFSLDAVVNGTEKIHANGSQNFPRHFDDFTDALYKLLNE